MSNFARIRSDYSPDTCLAMAMSEDGDISIKIYGDGEMRIATSGSRLHGEDLTKVLEAFRNVMNVIDEVTKNNEQLEGAIP